MASFAPFLRGGGDWVFCAHICKVVLGFRDDIALDKYILTLCPRSLDSICIVTY